MGAPIKVNLKIYQGGTFTKVFRWEKITKLYRSISNISLAAPLVITSTAHGVPAGWRVKLANVGGTKELNKDDYLIVTDTTIDTLIFNDINAKAYTTYTTGGTIEFNEPKVLTGLTARMQIRSKISEPDFLLELTTENGMIVLDNNTKTIKVTIPAEITETLTFKSAVYSLEMVEGSTVLPFIAGSISLDPEITR